MSSLKETGPYMGIGSPVTGSRDWVQVLLFPLLLAGIFKTWGIQTIFKHLYKLDF